MLTFDNSYAKLPDLFYSKLAPTPVEAPKLIRINHALAAELGVDPQSLSSAQGLEILAGNQTARGSDPLAMAYAGHQFGGFVPQLGDGRAILLGEVIDRNGVRKDVQLKGSGKTPYSRQGDGRAALGPVLREYIVSEAMAALGIPTTRALAAVLTGEMVCRDVPLPGAILTRVATSHVRIGTFQFFAARQNLDMVKRLADYVIERHYPEAQDAENKYREFLNLVIQRQADLVGQWMLIGFIHGVMNTDNMSVVGETIDYGPCAFMDTYHPETVYSSIDHRGRYAFCNQPGIAQWNLARLAETLLPLLSNNNDNALGEAQDAVNAYPLKFDASYSEGLTKKIGLSHSPENVQLAHDLLDRMAQSNADFTLVFRRLCDVTSETDEKDGEKFFDDPSLFQDWSKKWHAALHAEKRDPKDRRSLMRKINPAFIPRNHLVEEAISAAEEQNDFTVFEKLLSVLEKPFDDQPLNERYSRPPRPDQVVHKTFCGT